MKGTFIEEAKKMIVWLNDKKTFIVAVAGVTYGITGIIGGFITPEKGIEIIFASLGLGTVGHKVQKVLDIARKIKGIK